MGGVSVLLRGVYAFRVVRDAVHERVVGVFLARGVIGGESGVVGAYAGMLPGIVVSNGAQSVLGKVAVVPAGFFDAVIDLVFGALACFVVVRALPEHMLDGVPLIAVRAYVSVDEFGGFKAIFGAD